MSNLNVEKDFLENIDYLKELAKICEKTDKNDFDSNLLYEVGYAKLYIDKLILSQDKPSSDLIDLSVLFESVMNLANKSVEVNLNTREYNKLLKLRYAKEEDASYMADKPYDYSPIHSYLAKRLPTLIMISFVSFNIINGNLYKFVGKITELLTGVAISEATTEVESAVTTVSANIEAMNRMTSMFSSILGMVAMLMITCSAIVVTMDLVYIMCPWMRVVLGDRTMKWVSSEAVVSLDGEEKAFMRKVKSVERISRNKYWLSSMLEVLDKKSNMYNYIKELDKSIKDMKENSSEYYYSMAKIEFYRDKCIELGLI